ncbi:MAG: ABC transporter ATP-binding protein/permease [Oscillospiraceae bacterium]|nr:ABC transporter ATP-binding protein/permease [Oscillospiraceae bacterium]
MVEQENKKVKKKKEKQKYNIFQNISYALGNIWRWDKAYYLAFIPQIPISVFLPLAAVYFPKLLINLIQQKANDTTMLMTISGYCLILMGAGIIQLFCDARILSTNSAFASHYQAMIDTKHKTMDYENTENPKFSDMIGYAYDGGWSAEIIPRELNGLFINLLGIFTYGSIIGTLNPLILLLLIVSSIINYLTLTYVNRYTDKNRHKWAHLDRKNEYLYNMSYQYERAKDIKLYNMRVWLLELTKLYQDLRMKWRKKIYNKNLMSGIVDGGLQFIRDGVSYAVLISMLLNNKIDVGSFVFYFGAIAGFSGWLSSIIGKFNSVASQNIGINRLRAYFDLEDKFNHGKGIALSAKDEIPYEIEFRNLIYTYPGAEKPAVDNINFKIKKGERLAVVGVNGAGKTTLVNLMCGLYYPTSGSVLLNGKDAKEYNIDDYYTQFAAVFQEIRLNAIPISHFVAGNGENVDKTKVQNALKLAGLDKLVEELPHGMETNLIKGVYDDGIDLSGGEKQKLMLARALYKDAPVIVLDEPTAALDPIAENELYMKYADLTKGKTSIYISHRLSSTRFCDRIIYIQNGKIAEYGSHNELMAKNGLYANMFNIQSHYYKENIDNIEEGVSNDSDEI